MLAAAITLSTLAATCAQRTSSPLAPSASGAHSTAARAAAAMANADASNDAHASEACPDDRACLAPSLAQLGVDGAEARFEERPARIARLRAFAIERAEVTQRAYARCVRAGGCDAPSCERRASDAGLADAGADGDSSRDSDAASLFVASATDEPVACVRWSDARAYCAFIGGRLPTEAEWERAAAGPLPSHRRHPWGEALDAGLDDRTPEGVLALGGGVAEWVEDVGAFYMIPAVPNARDGGATDAALHDATADASIDIDSAIDSTDREIGNASAVEAMDASMTIVDDPRGPRSGAWRVIRGGHRAAPTTRWTSTARTFRRPDDTRPWLGFRCAFSR